MTLKIGEPIPDITLPASGGRTIRLRQFAQDEQALVVYFYPKDNTPGCTLEGQDFTALHPQFVAAGAQIVGISRDSVRAHDNFCAKYSFTFALLSDSEEVACKAFDVIKEKTLYGKKHMGIERSTFVFDAQGKLRHEWRGVKVKEHAQAVLEIVKAL
ncbi:peroxiredoxin [Sinimarinibacterium sp. NLF-5-8]|uniref:peroxiredoxin n=1 Tax=Sinimarinibacterium sp. NLF-5-8 TaxID=2698684 RepID=UPI00137B9D82|nr:peroxiredoxin [Sinimarinibacterium sp. NLF-5-8]QHS09459.1 peroxiredoxin [Sinimarinibacterium sp. NLF-5-8]